MNRHILTLYNISPNSYNADVGITAVDMMQFKNNAVIFWRIAKNTKKSSHFLKLVLYVYHKTVSKNVQ
jgi:hypothetical protein